MGNKLIRANFCHDKDMEDLLIVKFDDLVYQLNGIRNNITIEKIRAEESIEYFLEELLIISGRCKNTHSQKEVDKYYEIIKTIAAKWDVDLQ